MKCKAVVPPVASGTFTSGMDLNHCTLYVAPFTIDAYREATNWSDFYIIKPLNEPVKNIYVNRQMTFDLQSEDNAVLQDNPNMVLDYNTDNNYYSKSNNTVGQLTASGDGTLSAGVFTINNKFYNRGAYINQNNGIYYSDDRRPTLINNAENMRADSVLCIISMEPDEWHFISFQYDVQMSDVYGLNGTDFVIRQYNGAKRAAATEESTDKNNAPMRTIGGGSSSGSGSSQTVESNWEPVPLTACSSPARDISSRLPTTTPTCRATTSTTTLLQWCSRHATPLRRTVCSPLRTSSCRWRSIHQSSLITAHGTSWATHIRATMT